jgi:DNA polymerase III alpha subunit
MDISNQNKLSEFYEELKRLKVDIVRPDINECYADFRTIDNKFYYALGGLKLLDMKLFLMLLRKELRMENLNL